MSRLSSGVTRRDRAQPVALRQLRISSSRISPGWGFGNRSSSRVVMMERYRMYAQHVRADEPGAGGLVAPRRPASACYSADGAGYDGGPVIVASRRS